MCDFGTRLISMTNLVKKYKNSKSQKTHHYLLHDYFEQNEFQNHSINYYYYYILCVFICFKFYVKQIRTIVLDF